ncbi:trans-acting enoyl reductase family protein [Lewinella sp. LCG006]|uniref:saccharopine dehydrogenase family protein n=1 Tax=Lewinella sp. LCG006 TaxID=3231911 RepID=UPI00346171B6
MKDNEFLLYGAYGYTGRLIVQYAEQYQLCPILAGRNEAKLSALAEATGYDYLAFDLEDTPALIHALQKVPLVLHVAGPFIHTAAQMIEACLETKTHYLDITGEIDVFELAHRYGPAAEQNDIMLMPGTGFDVVPTDCLAKFLAEQMPDAEKLELAFAMQGGSVSRGTANTMIEGLGGSGKMRKDGRIIDLPLGQFAKTIPFLEDYHRLAMSIPWGDVSTAYYTTGIPNIITYTKVSPSTHRFTRWLPYIGWFLRLSWVRNIARRKVDNRPAGPDDQEREEGRCLVWGQVTAENGDTLAARFQGPEGYTLTAHSSLMITRKVLAEEVYPGFQTPAGAYGEDLVMEIAGTHREIIA